MPYVGRGTDKLSNVEVLDNITFDGSSSYTLQKGGSNFTPSSANTLLVSIDGVVQAGNFTVSGSTIDFGTAVAGTSTCDFILHYGIGLITTPSDGTVTTAKLADSSVSLAKLTATGTKDATTFLRGDNTFAEAGGGIEMTDTWRVTSNFSGDGVISSNWERDDTYSPGFIGTGMTESSGIFTFPSTGIYQINFGTRFTRDTATQYVIGKIGVTTDNSTYNEAGTSISNIPVANYYNAVYLSYIFDVTSTSTHKVRFETLSAGLVNFTGSTTSNHTYGQFIRLGDT